VRVLLQVVFCIVLFCYLLVNGTYEIPTYVSVGLPADPPPKTGNSNALKGAAKASPKKKNAPQAARKIKENKVTEEKDSPQEPLPP
jgi:hypothetical protein